MRTPESESRKESAAGASADCPKAAVNFRSVARSRLYVGLAFLGMGTWTALRFGVAFGRAAFTGQWLVLGGPSYFYPLGVIPALIGLGLVFFALGTTRRVHLECDTAGNVVVRERRAWQKKWRETPLPEIAATAPGKTRVSLTNARLAGRVAWVPVLLTYVILTWITGFKLATNPTTFGYGVEVAWTCVACGGIALAGLVSLVWWGGEYLEVRSPTRTCALEYYLPRGERSQFRARVGQILGFEREIFAQPLEFPARARLDGARVTASSVMLVLAITGRATNWLVGEWLFWCLCMTSATCLVVALAGRVVPGKKARAANPKGRTTEVVRSGRGIAGRYAAARGPGVPGTGSGTRWRRLHALEWTGMLSTGSLAGYQTTTLLTRLPGTAVATTRVFLTVGAILSLAGVLAATILLLFWPSRTTCWQFPESPRGGQKNPWRWCLLLVGLAVGAGLARLVSGAL